MTRETMTEKANRLLTSRRVVVVEARAGYSRTVVRGDSGLHEVVEDDTGRSCTCTRATYGVCSHQLAAGAVTAPVLAPVGARS